MNSKKLLLSVGAVCVVVVASYFFVSPYAQKVEQQEDATTVESKSPITEGAFAPQPPKASSDDAIKSNESSDDDDDSYESDSVSPVPETSTPTPAPKPSSNTYTAATVATHADETSCWSIINGSVYDLTSFVGKHPGGERNILKICGKDGTAAFEGQHGGDSKPEATLAGFYLGSLVQ